MPSTVKLRNRIFPRVSTDVGPFIFVSTMIPVTYWFELFVVVPSMYSVWSLWYLIHFLCGTFIMVNITSNFVAIILVDTSTKGEILASQLKPKWHFCAVCESVAPPRSWHCNVCNTCILKREHHCMFTGCCVGHYNHRYFFMFLVYMCIATLYATYFNNFFIWSRFDYQTPLSILKMIFPMAMLTFGLDVSAYQLYLLLYVINFAGIFFTGVLLYYHVNLLRKGAITYERTRHIEDYDLGVKQNIKEVLGEQWYLSWIFPFIQSKLPHDGIHWETRASWKTEASKHR